MSDQIQKNTAFLRSLFRKETAERPAFLARSSDIPIFKWEDGDYTLSERPIERWVPWVVGDYQKQVDWLEKLGDDSVPVAKLTTGTHVFAQAFGCEVHKFDDNNPCALPLAMTIEEAERIEEPDLWNCRGLMRVFELGRLVQKELGPDAFLGPCDMQSGFDTACLVLDKSTLMCAMADPDERPAVARLAAKCASLYKKFLIELRKEFPTMSPGHCPGTWAPPEMGPWLSNDECGAVNTETFEELMLPELVDLAETFGGLGMHCCASADHQFKSFGKIPNFYAFNRVRSKLGWTPIFNLAGPTGPTYVLAWISENDILELRAKAPAGTRFMFCWIGDNTAEAIGWLERMHSV